MLMQDTQPYCSVDCKTLLSNICCLSISGNNLRHVVCREFGRALGLRYSNDSGVIMNPTQRGYDPNLTLSDDDIKGIQSLYGRRLPFWLHALADPDLQ